MEKSQEHFIALIDIMGFADFVKNETTEYVHKYLSDLIVVSKQFNQNLFDYNIKIFSDTIVISTPIQKESKVEFHKFLIYINNLQLANIIEPRLGRLPLRGAITKGEFFTDNKDLIFGKALVEVAEIEKDTAFYPRIIAPEELMPEKVRASTGILHSVFIETGFDKKVKGGGLENFNEHSYPVRRDFDGLLCCNYLYSLKNFKGGWANDFETYIQKHRNFIIHNLGKSKTYSVVRKYGWMKEYHNWFCSGYEELKDYVI